MFSVDGSELSEYQFHNALINGKGRISYDGTASDHLPLATFDVQTNQRYRFRIVHTGAEFTLEISVDKHELTIVASDGHELEPFDVTSFFIFPGESVDFEITTRSADKVNYWIRSDIIRYKTGVGGQPDGVKYGARAILKYNRSSMVDPSSSSRSCSAIRPCIILNCPYRGYPGNEHIQCITFNDIQSADSNIFINSEYGINDKDYEEVFINIGFPSESGINGFQFIFPRAPLFGDAPEDHITSCQTPECTTGCQCTNIMNLPLNKTIQMLISNYQSPAGFDHHAMHFHGHSFAVLKMGHPDYNRTTGD